VGREESMVLKVEFIERERERENERVRAKI
jgi:hypothetical protein